MSQKKINKTKPLIFGGIAVVCITFVGVLALSLGNASKPGFEADPVDMPDKNASWSESFDSSQGAKSPTGAIPGEIINQVEGTPEDAYPLVNSNGEDGENAADDKDVNITFVNPNPPVEERPTTPPQEHKPTENTAPNNKPSEKTSPDNPVPGQKNAKGEVYDPVFGWIMPSGTAGETVDNSGDVDKQIGSMG